MNVTGGEWLTFGLMMFIQVVTASSIASRISYITNDLVKEVAELRKWRHDFGQKEMLYDDSLERLEKLETRVGALETRHHTSR